MQNASLKASYSLALIHRTGFKDKTQPLRQKLQVLEKQVHKRESQGHLINAVEEERTGAIKTWEGHCLNLEDQRRLLGEK